MGARGRVFVGRLIREGAPFVHNSALRTNPKHGHIFDDLIPPIPSPSSRNDSAAPIQLGPYMATKMAEARDAIEAAQAQVPVPALGPSPVRY